MTDKYWLAQATSSAFSLDEEVQAISLSSSEPGYALKGLRACPDRYCASFGRWLLIFGMLANVATVATICPVVSLVGGGRIFTKVRNAHFAWALSAQRVSRRRPQLICERLEALEFAIRTTRG